MGSEMCIRDRITSFLYNHSDTGLVVIDTLQKVRSCDQSGSMYASDYKDVSALKSLADKYGICILLIHHLRKQAASDPFDQISGSNGLMGAADTTWVIYFAVHQAAAVGAGLFGDFIPLDTRRSQSIFQCLFTNNWCHIQSRSHQSVTASEPDRTSFFCSCSAR